MHINLPVPLSRENQYGFTFPHHQPAYKTLLQSSKRLVDVMWPTDRQAQSSMSLSSKVNIHVLVITHSMSSKNTLYSELAEIVNPVFKDIVSNKPRSHAEKYTRSKYTHVQK